MNWFPYSDSAVFPDVIKSLILLTIALIVRLVVIRAVRHSQSLSADVKRRWVLTIRNAMAFLFVTGLIFIWAHELSTFAVSLVAIAVAVVLATKELILCLSGTVLRAGTNAYTLGDRIEIAGTRGNVVDQKSPRHDGSGDRARAHLVPIYRPCGHLPEQPSPESARRQ